MDQRRFDSLTRLLARALDRRAGLRLALPLAVLLLLGDERAMAKRGGKRQRKRRGAGGGQHRRHRKPKKTRKKRHRQKEKRQKKRGRRNDDRGPRNCNDAPLQQGAELAGCDLRQHPDLDRADFTNAKLEDAILSGAALANVSFRGARLWRAKLDGANLTNANFNDSGDQRTDVFAVDFSDADLTGATLDSNDVLYAHYAVFCHTTMPNGEIDDSGCS
jgi:hypothetical protein